MRQPTREPAADALAQVAAGAALEEDELADLTAHRRYAHTDPVRRLLATQTLLLQRLAPKPQDPLTRVLQRGGGNDSGSSGGGVCGHSAREACLRQLEDHAEVARAIRANACADGAELGYRYQQPLRTMGLWRTLPRSWPTAGSWPAKPTTSRWRRSAAAAP